MEKEIQEKIFDLYVNQQIGVRKTAKLINVSRRKLENYLHEMNLMRKPGTNKKNFQDDLYFHDINTSEKAYWLGYFYADGNVSKTGNKVTISSIDFETVNNFKKAVNFTGKILIETHRKFCKTINKIAIYSNQMHQDLVLHGCIPAKSLIITFPNLSKNLIPHFIRGYFDGDGSVGIYMNSTKKKLYTLRSSFCSGSKVFLEQLQQFLPVKTYKIKIRKNPMLFTVNFSVKDSIKLAEYMYKDATIFLTRKKKKFDNYRERRSTTIISHPETDEGIV